MTVEEGIRYVAAAYAIILAVLIAYCFVSARRLSALRRDVELLEDEAKRRRTPAGEAGAE